MSDPTRSPRLMARAASLPCPSCEGMLTTTLEGRPLHHACGTSLTVVETREDPDHPMTPAVWRWRRCPEDDTRLATVQFLVPAEGAEGPGGRWHRCQDCGATFTSLERPVDQAEATDRLAHLARERTMLARAGRRFSHPTRDGKLDPVSRNGDPWAATRALPPTVAWHREGR